MNLAVLFRLNSDMYEYTEFFYQIGVHRYRGI